MTSLPVAVAQAQHLAPTAASAAIAAAWQGALLVTLVALALRLLPRLAPAVRSILWTATLALAVALPLLSLVFPAHTSTATTHAPLHLATSWSVALAALWLTLSSIRFTQLALSAWHLVRIARRSVEVDPAILQAKDPAILDLLRTSRRHPRLCVSPEVDRPSVAGFFFPRILIPVGLLDRISALELEQIVLHEREHLERNDDWIHLAQKLALALFPLHPALFYIERRLATERELACDDTVLRATRAPKAYALCLASLAEQSLARRTALLALAAWQRRPELARRVDRILLTPTRTMARRPALAAASAVLLAALGSAATLAHAPALISFIPTQPVELASTQTLPQTTLTTAPTAASAFTANPAETFVSADATAMKRLHSSSLVMTVPTSPINHLPPQATRRTRRPKPRVRAINLSARMPAQTRSTLDIAARAAETAPTHTVFLRQIVATQDGELRTWTLIARFNNAPVTTDPQPADNTGDTPKQPPTDTQTSNTASSTTTQQRPQSPKYHPAYAAFPTAHGWLVLEL